jgi:hypothetical protein
VEDDVTDDHWEGWGVDADGRPVPLSRPIANPDIDEWVVVCTDRGQHPPSKIATFYDRRRTSNGDVVGIGHSRPTTRRTRQGRQYEKAYAASMPETIPSQEATFVLGCPYPSCKRRVEIRPQRFAQKIDALLTIDPDRARVVDLPYLD